MNRFLLINNKAFFDKHNVFTINKPEDIPDKNAMLFIGSHTSSIDDPNHILEYFKDIEKKKYKYIIIVGKGDSSVLSDVKIPKNIVNIYCNNINYNHKIIKFMPMGSDFRSINSFSKCDFNNTNRNILCYCNFSINTNPVRKKIFNKIKDKPFIKFEHMSNFLEYNISRNKFFKKLNRSKYVICPVGNALDTFRFYDTIYAGAIPIVVKQKFHDLPIFNDIPILFLNHHREFRDIDQSFLEREYDKLIKKKSYYKDLDMEYFMLKIKKQIDSQ